MLRNAAMILGEPQVDPGGIDGEIARDAQTSATVKAIEAFQSRFLTNADGVIDVGGRTWRELVGALNGGGQEESSPAQPQGTSEFFFPFTQLPSANWTGAPRSFGSNRSGGRAHAACDLYFPKGTIIHAITAGTVVRGPYPFYAQTFALEIDHGTFIARYGEIQETTFVRTNDRVTAGQPIAKVGHLIGIATPSDMLHLELYDKSGHGPLTVAAAQSAKTAAGRPFLRRKDLMDPTLKLNQWKNNLPGS
jgi:murein DD-endopeptidase MepM/ murein hydrolase activator NlpD